MKVLVEDVLGPQLVGEDPTQVEFLWEKLYGASRLPLALAHGRPYTVDQIREHIATVSQQIAEVLQDPPSRRSSWQKASQPSPLEEEFTG